MGMSGWKGFGPDWKCRDFQYEVGKEYETDETKLCNRGFHFCEDPLDVLNYYPFIDNSTRFNRFATIEGENVSDEKSDEDTKRVASKLKISAEIGIAGLIKAGVEYIRTKIKDSATTGNEAHSATTGNEAHSATTGDKAHSATTGDKARSATTGDKAHSATTGYKAHSAVDGKNSIAASLGIDGCASGAVGSWIVLVEWVNREDGWTIKGIKTVMVDGERIKANTLYRLKNGKFVKAKM